VGVQGTAESRQLSAADVRAVGGRQSSPRPQRSGMSPGRWQSLPPEPTSLTPCSPCAARVTLCGQVERLIVARHAESAYNVQGLISADPSSHRSPLTSRGIQQARSLADRLAGDEIDLCVASRTLRAVQTAEIVASALPIPLMTTPLLDDPPAGVFEDGPVEAFVRWMSGCDADTPVPGTSMSLRDSARRYFEATTLLLRRPERTILVVAHAPALRWTLQAAQGRSAPLDYHHPLFTHADAVDVDVVALGNRMDALASDQFVVLSRGERRVES